MALFMNEMLCTDQSPPILGYLIHMLFQVEFPQVVYRKMLGRELIFFRH